MRRNKSNIPVRSRVDSLSVSRAQNAAGWFKKEARAEELPADSPVVQRDVKDRTSNRKLSAEVHPRANDRHGVNATDHQTPCLWGCCQLEVIPACAQVGLLSVSFETQICVCLQSTETHHQHHVVHVLCSRSTDIFMLKLQGLCVYK